MMIQETIDIIISAPKVALVYYTYKLIKYILFWIMPDRKVKLISEIEKK